MTIELLGKFPVLSRSQARDSIRAYEVSRKIYQWRARAVNQLRGAGAK
jgi:hypothetical protein